MMKVLITGANGQLGQELVKVFEKDWVVVATDTDNLDITNKKQVLSVIKKERPNLVIHCAAWTNVDAAAEDPKAVMKVNGEGTRNICEVAKEIGARVVYISTAEVFDGKKQTPYEETDEPHPINPYAKSKRQGEIYCQQLLGEDCIIARPSWLYGPASKNNFPNKIVNRFKEQGFLTVVDDEFGVPTYAPDFAKMILELVEMNVSGVFHTVNKGSTSRYGWAKEILKQLGYKEADLKPIKLKDFKRASTPPPYSVLSTAKIESLGITTRNWRVANKEYIQKI
jgi:dTDP-4-dehydrorhamnose reductase